MCASAPGAEALSQSSPVLFLKGYTPPLGTGDCTRTNGPSYLGLLTNSLRAQGFTNVKTVSLMYPAPGAAPPGGGVEYNCDVNLLQWAREHAATMPAPVPSPNVGFVDIAYYFARYVYSEYTSKGIAVSVVGYSTGGNVAREAIQMSNEGTSFRLDETNRKVPEVQNSVLRPSIIAPYLPYLHPLDITDAVSVEAPFEGNFGLPGVDALSESDTPGSDALKNLNVNKDPQGPNGTRWGSVWSSGDKLVPEYSALSMSIPACQKKVIQGGPDHEYVFTSSAEREAVGALLQWPCGAPSEQVFQLAGVESKKCIDIDGMSTQQGAPATLWPCKRSADPTRPSQTFHFIPQETQGYGWLQDEYTGQQLTVENVRTDNEAPVIQWHGPQGNNGLWKPADLGNGEFAFVNKNSGKCLDVRGFGTADHTPLQQYDCHSSLSRSNQAFLECAGDNCPTPPPPTSPLPGGLYVFQHSDSPGLCLDLEKSTVGNYDPVHLWGCNGSNDQKWFYEPTTFELHPWDNTAYCLDGNGAPPQFNGHLIAYLCNGGTNEQFHATAGVGSSGLLNMTGYGFCADIEGDPPYAGDPATNGSCADPDSMWTAQTTSANKEVEKSGSSRLPEGYYVFEHADSPGLCLDLENGTPYNGDPVHLWSCNGSTDQKWTWAAELGQLISADSQKTPANYCLDAGSTAPYMGERMWVWECHPPGSSERADQEIYPVGGQNQASVLEIWRFGMCVDIEGDPPYAGDPLTDYTCTDPDSVWIPRPQ
jgi:hypothetical protein